MRIELNKGIVQMKLIGLFLVCIVMVTSCGKKEEASEEIVPSVAWQEIKASGVSQTRKLAGELIPELGGPLSFGVDGQVTKIYVSLGDKVKKGQVLAKLNASDYQNNFNSAQSDLRNKESLYQRMVQARESRAVSQQEVADAKNDYDMALANLAIVKKSLMDTQLRAPYDGIITTVDVDEAQQIQVGRRCFEIDSGTGLEIDVSVPETMIEKLIKNKSYEVSFPAFRGLRMEAILTEIGTQARKANAFPVTLKLKKQSEQLRSGMSAEVYFTFEEKDAEGILIPNSALGVGIGEESYIYVYDNDSSTIKKIIVKPFNITNNDVYIKAPLNDGDIVITAGVSYLSDGQKVKLLEQKVDIFN